MPLLLGRAVSPFHAQSPHMRIIMTANVSKIAKARNLRIIEGSRLGGAPVPWPFLGRKELLCFSHVCCPYAERVLLTLLEKVRGLVMCCLLAGLLLDLLSKPHFPCRPSPPLLSTLTSPANRIGSNALIREALCLPCS